ncbi:hypothetical protein GY45DRAFT_1319012 [Cubamyces sp. BRFM 1775]|nr:hypothetical protein GY45DRAFT_1319012 [Cubamyces sp. BRFM 1775]
MDGYAYACQLQVPNHLAQVAVVDVKSRPLCRPPTMLHLASSIPPVTRGALDRGPEAERPERSGYSGRYVLWVQSSEGFAKESSALIGLCEPSCATPRPLAPFRVAAPAHSGVQDPDCGAKDVSRSRMNRSCFAGGAEASSIATGAAGLASS